MARGIEGNEISTPKPPTLKKSASSSQSTSKGQKSILGFFSKQAPTPKSAFSDRIKTDVASEYTPAPSSDALAPSSPVSAFHSSGKNKENGLPSQWSLMEPVAAADGVVEELNGIPTSSPSRMVHIHIPIQRLSSLANHFVHRRRKPSAMLNPTTKTLLSQYPRGNSSEDPQSDERSAWKTAMMSLA